MKKVIIECDQCGKDISVNDTGYEHSYIYKITAQDTPRTSKRGGFVFGMAIYPDIKDELYFCSVRCLANYSITNFKHQ